MEENNSDNSKNIRIIFFNIIFAVLMLIIIYLLFITARANIRGNDPSLFGYRFYHVDSGSMSPTIPVGSLIIVKETSPVGIKIKDIITYKGPDKTLVTHRVMEISKDGGSFITRGDANKSDDPFPIKGDKVVGRVILNIHYLGYVLKILKSKYGLALISIIILWTVISLLSGGKKAEIKKN